MASIARCRAALGSEPLDQSEFVREYLSKNDLTEPAAAAKYRWRERIRTPAQTFWVFLLQVLHPGWVCREAVAHVLAQLQARGCAAVFRLRGARARTVNSCQGQRLGKEDRLFTWTRAPSCPRTLTPEEFAQLPATLMVRVLRFDTRCKDFRRRIPVVTTLLDPKAFPLEKIAALTGTVSRSVPTV